jgi:hypothetical protein
VESFSPTGEVQNLTNFTIEFSEDLAPADVQDKWLDEEFVTFTPAIQGKFKWTSPSTLIFSPDAPLDPMQSYEQQLIKCFIQNDFFLILRIYVSIHLISM